MVFGVTTAMLIAGLLHVPRRMWIGIAAMSILVPFHEDAKKRAKSRVPGNIVGCFIFLALYYLLPPSIYNYVGVIGGIGVGAVSDLWLSGCVQHVRSIVDCGRNPRTSGGGILPYLQ